MTRMPKEPNERLLDLIHEAGFSHKGLARRINDLGKARGIAGLSYDHSSVIRWLKGEHPRHPAPKLAAEVFSLTLARPITEADLGFPNTHDFPELGLRFTPSLPDTIETVTTLWRSDVERRQFIVNATFAAGVYASSAIRWLTTPTPASALTKPSRQVGKADIEAIREVTKTFLRLVSCERGSFTGRHFGSISSAVLVQVKGWQRSFQPSMKASMAAMRSLTEVKLPRRIACRVMIEKKTSARFSQEPEVGRKVQRDPGVPGQPGPHVRVGVRAVVIQTICSLRRGYARATWRRNSRNSSCRCRG